jgi:hypothetical protein
MKRLLKVKRVKRFGVMRRLIRPLLFEAALAALVIWVLRRQHHPKTA